MNGERYRSLPRAPIVEAVIYWLAEPGKKLEQEELKRELRERLADYPMCDPQLGVEISASGGLGATGEFVHRTRWDGFRLKKDDEPFVAQFTPNGVVFSRLAPYKNWENLEREGVRLWELFVELAKPVLIRRLGVRFINRIQLRGDEKSSDYLHGSPTGIVPDFTLETFFYKDTFRVSETPYNVNWIRTIQSHPSGNEKALIVDIDVGASDISATDTIVLKKHLAKMRDLKNRVFFQCMTPFAMERFEEP